MFSEYRDRKFSVEKAEIRKPASIRDTVPGRQAFKSFTKIETENIPQAMEILKEVHPKYNFSDNRSVACLISFEFECICTEEQVKESRKYYEPMPPEEEELRLLYKHCLE